MMNPTKHEQRTFWKRLVHLFKGLFDRLQKCKSLQQIIQVLDDYVTSSAFERQVRNVLRNVFDFRRRKSAASWRQAATQAMHSRKIYQGLQREMQGPVGDAVRDMVTQNAQYIKTISPEYATKATHIANKMFLEGKRTQAVIEQLKKVIPESMQTNLKTVARTELSKANAAITQARAQNINIHCYKWKTCRDERVRDSHAMMQDVIIFYDNPPSPQELAGVRSYGRYHAGCIFNCRCYQEPVVGLRFLPDMNKVYEGNRIVSMSRAQIISKYGNKTEM